MVKFIVLIKDDNYDFADGDEYRKIGSIRIDRDYYKPIKTDDSFAGKKKLLYRI